MSTNSKIVTIVRVGVAGAVGAYAVLAYAGTRPDPSPTLNSVRSMRSIDANRAESAPQQTVVNGWETNDLLAYMAEQQDAYATQQSALLLIIAVTGALLLLAPLLKSARTDQPQAPQAPAVSPAPVYPGQGTHAQPSAPAALARPTTATPHQAPGADYGQAPR